MLENLPIIHSRTSQNLYNNTTYVTGFEKTDHLCTFIVLKNVNLKNSLSYNSAIISSRGMGLALEIQHLFSFK